MAPDTMQDLTNWLCLHEDEINIGINDFGELQQVFFEVVGRNAGDIFNVAEAECAARYRWLVAKLREAYDGNNLEIGDFVIGCSMRYSNRKERCVMGMIRWIDARDEPLNLNAAIDAARALESTNGREEEC